MKNDFNPETFVREYNYLKKATLRDYFWEFLRRNGTYRQLYAQFEMASKIYCAIGNKYPEALHDNITQAPIELQKAYADLQNAQDELLKYGVAFPVNPACRSDDAVFRSSFREIYFGSSSLNYSIIQVQSYDGISNENTIAHNQWTQDHPENITIKLDVLAPLEKITYDLNNLIKAYQDAFKLRLQERPNRAALTKWRYYLMVYDLSADHKITKPYDIAAIVYPDTSNIDPTYIASNKVSRNLKAANELIDGGFRTFAAALPQAI